MAHFMAKTVGLPEAGNLEDWITRSQMTQAEGIRQALERHRTSQGRHAGSLYWSLNDVWPAVSWSSVDHAGRWKLSHYAARRANAPQMAIWHRARSDSLEMIVFNDKPDSLLGHLCTAVCDFYGDTIDSRVVNISLAGRTSKRTTIASMIDWKKNTRDTYLSWSLCDATGAKTCQQSALWESPDQTRLPPTNVTLVRTESGWRLESDRYVPMIQITSSMPGHWSDNGMPLEPGIPCDLTFVPEDSMGRPMEIDFRMLNPKAQ